jgi:hypothetical protein
MKKQRISPTRNISDQRRIEILINEHPAYNKYSSQDTYEELCKLLFREIREVAREERSAEWEEIVNNIIEEENSFSAYNRSATRIKHMEDILRIADQKGLITPKEK